MAGIAAGCSGATTPPPREAIASRLAPPSNAIDDKEFAKVLEAAEKEPAFARRVDATKENASATCTYNYVAYRLVTRNSVRGVRIMLFGRDDARLRDNTVELPAGSTLLDALRALAMPLAPPPSSAEAGELSESDEDEPGDFVGAAGVRRQSDARARWDRGGRAVRLFVRVSVAAIPLHRVAEQIFAQLEEPGRSLIPSSTRSNQDEFKNIVRHIGTIPRRQIGLGGLATVYEIIVPLKDGADCARAPHLCKRYAIKEVNKNDPRIIAAEIAPYVYLGDNANITKYFGSFRNPTSNLWTMVFEAADSDLAHLLVAAEHAATPTDAERKALGKAAVRGLVNGLAFMHTHGLADRDVKPENILAFSNPRGGHTFKLADLSLGLSARQRRALKPEGTPRYMSRDEIRCLSKFGRLIGLPAEELDQTYDQLGVKPTDNLITILRDWVAQVPRASADRQGDPTKQLVYTFASNYDIRATDIFALAQTLVWIYAYVTADISYLDEQIENDFGTTMLGITASPEEILARLSESGLHLNDDFKAFYIAASNPNPLARPGIDDVRPLIDRAFGEIWGPTFE